MRNRRDRPCRGRGKVNAAFVRNAVILAVHVKPMEVGIAPAHGDWDGARGVGNALVTAKRQTPPDHRANAAQHHFELVHPDQLWTRHRIFI